MNHGQVFGDEILLLKAGRLMQKFVESKQYTVTCISMGAKVLMFNADDLLKLIDKVPSVMEDLKNQYRLKLPMARDTTETFRDIYKRMSAIRSCDIKDSSKDIMSQQPVLVEETVTGLPTRDVRNMLNECVQPPDGRWALERTVEGFP